MPTLTMRRPRSVSALSATSSSYQSFTSSSSSSSSAAARTVRTYNATPTSLTLLNRLAPAFTSVVRVSKNALLSHRRRLEIRADLLLLLKVHSGDRTTSCINAKDVILAVDLPSLQHVHKLSSTSLIFTHILLSHKLTFQSAAQLTTFISKLPSVPLPSPEPQPISDALLHALPVLGEGATATVRLLPDDTAVKCMPKPGVYDSDDNMHQLLNEVSALRALRGHPNIVSLLSTRQTHQQFLLLTEHAHYGDLHSLLLHLPHRRLPAPVAAAVFAQMCDGLAAVHGAGYLYRDMKLANVLVDRAGTVKLADFGLCHPVKAAGEAGRAKSFVGTRRYMAPELIAPSGGVRKYGSSVDVWALGVALYVMVTGTYPHHVALHGAESDESVPDPTSLFLTIANDDVPVPNSLDEDLRDLLARILNRDPLERPSLQQVMQHAWAKKAREEQESNASGVFLEYLRLHNVPCNTPPLKRIESEGTFDAALTNGSDEEDEPAQEAQVGFEHLLGFEYDH